MATYNVYTESNIRLFFDSALSILNLIISIIFIITLKKIDLKNIPIDEHVKSSKNIISYIFTFSLFILGFFILFFISKNSVYKFTPYSLGTTFIFQSILIFYFSVKK